ncbi:hypothetical protein CFOL_v3_29126 [Cephalotus follicularis]|uniref:Secreted protein n=1 Tax=Cephalotus follicularis TaxID=3775 RepID=A0A1Q3CZR6_CEPFO|nr:hypothetical protein CFOL_v3_29126 [Cephalotus follicularis]
MKNVFKLLALCLFGSVQPNRQCLVPKRRRLAHCSKILKVVSKRGRLGAKRCRLTSRHCRFVWLSFRKCFQSMFFNWFAFGSFSKPEYGKTVFLSKVLRIRWQGKGKVESVVVFTVE